MARSTFACASSTMMAAGRFRNWPSMAAGSRAPSSIRPAPPRPPPGPPAPPRPPPPPPPPLFPPPPLLGRGPGVGGEEFLRAHVERPQRPELRFHDRVRNPPGLKVEGDVVGQARLAHPLHVPRARADAEPVQGA